MKKTLYFKFEPPFGPGSKLKWVRPTRTLKKTSWGWARAHPRLIQLAWSYHLLRVELEILSKHISSEPLFLRTNFVLEKICAKEFNRKHLNPQNLCLLPPKKCSRKNCWPQKNIAPQKMFEIMLVTQKNFVKKDLSKKN